MLLIKTTLFPGTADSIPSAEVFSLETFTSSFLETPENFPVPQSTLSRYVYPQDYDRQKMICPLLLAGKGSRERKCSAEHGK